MIYSHNVEDDKFSLFTLFVKSLLSGEKKYEGIVNPVLKDAHELAVKEKDVQEIDKDNFSIIIYLERKNPEFIKKIQPDHISDEEYKTVLSLLEDHSQASFI